MLWYQYQISRSYLLPAIVAILPFVDPAAETAGGYFSLKEKDHALFPVRASYVTAHAKRTEIPTIDIGIIESRWVPKSEILKLVGTKIDEDVAKCLGLA